jgi:hypothetical protein
MYPWHELYGPANVPNWFLAVIGTCGIFAAVRTLRAIERQSGLMKEQMDRMVERERARLTLHVQRIEVEEAGIDWVPLNSCLELTNCGHSNAYIRFSAARFVICPAGQWPLPQPDPERLAISPGVIEPSISTVYAPVWTEDEPFSLQETIAKMLGEELGIYLYGFIEYETLGILWHRNFGYRWNQADQPTTTRDLKNPEREFLTGEWEFDVRQKNDEYQVTAPVLPVATSQREPDRSA